MQDFFDTIEHRWYALLAVLAGTTTLFFIASQTPSLAILKTPLENDTFYILFIILMGLTLGSLISFTQIFNWKSALSTILLLWFPAALILTYGLSESKNFHYLFNIAVGLYVILAGVLLAVYFVEKNPAPKDPSALSWREWFRTQGILTLTLVTIATILFFSVGLFQLTKYAAVDEPLWLDGRIHRYWKNIGEHDWKGTNISDKPGITVALATGIGTLFKSSSEFKTTHFQGEVFNLRNNVEAYYFAFRFPALVCIALLLPLFYFFLERLLGRTAALLSYLFIATSPILVGISKIINPDSLLWLFAPLSLLAYLTFLRRSSYRYLIFAGILLGLALLTKYVANILFIFFFGLIFLEYIFLKATPDKNLAAHLKLSLKHLLLLAFTASVTFYLLFPAVWLKPMKLLTGTLLSQAFEKVAPLFLVLTLVVLADQWLNQARLTSGLIHLIQKWRHWLIGVIGGIFSVAVIAVLFNTWFGMPFANFADLLSSPKTIATRSDFLSIFLTNFYPLLFGITPLTLLLIFGSPILFSKRYRPDSQEVFVLLSLILFILLYYLGATVNGVASIVRYQIILFPLVAIMAGIALSAALTRFHQHFPSLETWSSRLLPIIVLLLGMLTLFSTPYPLSYASAALPKEYHIDVKDMGAGSYEAAAWLNSLPGAKDMLIWTDKDGVCKFFVGRCSSGHRYTMLRENGLDYIVTSAGRESRTTKMMAGDIANQKSGLIRFDQYYKRTDPVHTILINDRPTHFVKIFKFEE